MIGWINLSVEGFICDSFGRDAWVQIVKEAHVDCNWVSSCPYPDKVTYDLVITGAGILGVTVPQALEAYGQYFVNYVIKQGYTRLLKSLGSNIAEFLANLNNLHLHLTMGFPSMVAPAFRVEEVTSTSLLLHYHSIRPALWPIVSGVLKGASKVLFEHEVEMELVASREAGDCDHEIFKVLYPHQEALQHWDDHDAALASSYSMTKDFFYDMFPFHIILDKDCAVVQVGRIMGRLFGETLTAGSAVTDTFKLRHPYIAFEYDKMIVEKDSLFLLKALQTGLEFKGQMVQTTMPGGVPVLLFLGSPRVANLEEMAAHQLYLSDIPLHDMSRDFVLLAEQRQAEADLKERFEKLAVDLRVANDRLEQATRWLDEERQRSDALLYRMLPADIAADLREGRKVEAISYQEVTILFSDMVGFTNTSAKSTPEEVYNMLNEMYDKFDGIVDDFPDVYKLETIGDAYFLVCNLTTECENHVDVVIDFAIRMQAAARQVKSAQGEPVQIRIGIHTGPVVGGVLGAKTPRFSIYGDTVNVASRMESHGLPGKIHISDVSYNSIVDKAKYAVRERGNIAVKGRGNMTTYLIGGTNDDWLLRHTSFDAQLDVGANQGSFVITGSGRSTESLGLQRATGPMEAIKEGDEDRTSRNPLRPFSSGAMLSGGSHSTSASSQVPTLSATVRGSEGGGTPPASMFSALPGSEVVRAVSGLDALLPLSATGTAGGGGSGSGLMCGGSFRDGPQLVRDGSLREGQPPTVARDTSFRAVYARGGRPNPGSPLVSTSSRLMMGANTVAGASGAGSDSDAPSSGANAYPFSGGGGGGGDGSAGRMHMVSQHGYEPSPLSRPEASSGSAAGLAPPSGFVIARSATSKASPLAPTSHSVLPVPPAAASPSLSKTAHGSVLPSQGSVLHQLQSMSLDDVARRGSSSGNVGMRPSEIGSVASTDAGPSKAKGLARKLKNLFKK